MCPSKSLFCSDKTEMWSDAENKGGKIKKKNNTNEHFAVQRKINKLYATFGE